MYYVLSFSSRLFVLHLAVRISFLILFSMSLLLGGLNLTMRIPAMTTTSPHADATPVAHQNSTSSQEGEELSVEIQGAKAKVMEAEKWDKYASRTNTVLLVLYALVTGAVVCSSVWNGKTTARLRAFEKLLNDLEKAKIRADSILKTEVETEKVRQGAARDLALASRELDAIAAARVEEVRGHAEAKVEQVRGEAFRQNRELQKEVASQQERAAIAERRLIEVQGRMAWRVPLSPKFRETLESGAKGNALIVYEEDDDEACSFAWEIWSEMASAKWTVTIPSVGKTVMQEAGTGGGHRPGIAVVISESEGGVAMEPYLRDKPSDALMKAFCEAGLQPFHLLPLKQFRPPIGFIKIVVGSRFG
jgi:hypothetical protein